MFLQPIFWQWCHSCWWSQTPRSSQTWHWRQGWCALGSCTQCCASSGPRSSRCCPGLRWRCGNHLDSSPLLIYCLCWGCQKTTNAKLPCDIPVIPFKCPSRNIIHCPVLRSHTLPNESKPLKTLLLGQITEKYTKTPPEQARAPSSWNATVYTSLLWPSWWRT